MSNFVRFNKKLVIDTNGIIADADACGPPDLVQVQNARKFLSIYGRKTASVSKKQSSYGLKHTAEKMVGLYISNGALILAAKELGYRMRQCGQGSPNVYLNIKFAARQYREDMLKLGKEA